MIWDIAYLLIGFVVAARHIAQHNMRVPIDHANREMAMAGFRVEYLLALLWPVLLFDQAANALQARGNAVGGRKASRHDRPT